MLWCESETMGLYLLVMLTALRHMYGRWVLLEIMKHIFNKWHIFQFPEFNTECDVHGAAGPFCFFFNSSVLVMSV